MSSYREALALVEFAGAMFADRALAELFNEGTIGTSGDEKDRWFAVTALANVAEWLNKADMADYVSRKEASR